MLRRLIIITAILTNIFPAFAATNSLNNEGFSSAESELNDCVARSAGVLVGDKKKGLKDTTEFFNDEFVKYASISIVYVCNDEIEKQAKALGMTKEAYFNSRIFKYFIGGVEAQIGLATLAVIGVTLNGIDDTKIKAIVEAYAAAKKVNR